MSDFGECIGKLLFKFVFRCMWTAVIIIIDRQIVARRDLVIRCGRRTQGFLHVPQCLRVFADTDLGMLDGDIRIAAELLFFCRNVG